VLRARVARQLDDEQARLKAWAEAVPGGLTATRSAKPDAPWTELFGFADADSAAAVGGKLIFFDAFHTEQPAASDRQARAANPARWNRARLDAEPHSDRDRPFWDPVRRTAVAVAVSLDRGTRSARENLLYHLEHVPAGETFRIEIGGDNLTDRDVGLVLQLLDTFGPVPERSAAPPPPRDAANCTTLGALESNGWGRLGWRCERVSRLAASGLADWVKDPRPGFAACTELLDATALKSAAGPSPFVPNPARLTVALAITVDSSRLVRDPRQRDRSDLASRNQAQEAAKPPDAIPIQDSHGPYLPAKGLRGALRARAEMILRTLGRDCAAHPADLPSVTTKRQGCAGALVQIGKADPAAQLFGLSGWRAPLAVSRFVPEAAPPTHRQEFVAVDRFTGGGAERRKFNAELAGSTVLTGTLDLDLDRLRAGERTDEADSDTGPADLLPFTPHGQNRGPNGAANPDRPRRAYYLKPGDLVFFRPTADGKAVAEVSLSSIWRGRVETVADGVRAAATLSDFIATADPDLLPMGEPRKTRMTPAELLFGFAEHLGSRALAGRVQFSMARPTPGQAPLLNPDWIDLGVLNGPKPPSPNFYFRNRPGQKWLAKSRLSLNDDRIQGRKFYLHTQDAPRAKRPDDPRWTMHPRNVASSDYDRMRVRVRPVLADRTFEFEVRFDNLSRFEIGALIHALRPDAAFHHKLGLGKPLGLGTVRIDPLDIERVDRHRRYALDPLDGPRFHAAWHRDVASGQWDGPDAPSVGNPPAWVAGFLEELRKFDPAQTALRALLTLGDPAKVIHPVHYPQVAGIRADDPAFEADRYEWVVANDHKNTPDADRQHLGVVGPALPMLERLPKVERGESRPARFPPGGPSRGAAAGSPGTETRSRGDRGHWQGPVTCTCKGRGHQGDWRFEFADDTGPHWGFLDRDAEPPANLKPDQRLAMYYKTTAQGRYFFRPA
jgi:CRISPR/Cas system CSM-associated protein Csm3 (group 7 of RAMP superfamily)